MVFFPLDECYFRSAKACQRGVSLRSIFGAVFPRSGLRRIPVPEAAVRQPTLRPGGRDIRGHRRLVADRELRLEIDRSVRQHGAVNTFSLKEAPAQPAGMACSVIDKLGHVQLRVTSEPLSVTAKGIDGKPVGGCPTLSLRYRR